jgi:hypothetical protein
VAPVAPVWLCSHFSRTSWRSTRCQTVVSQTQPRDVFSRRRFRCKTQTATT